MIIKKHSLNIIKNAHVLNKKWQFDELQKLEKMFEVSQKRIKSCI